MFTITNIHSKNKKSYFCEKKQDSLIFINHCNERDIHDVVIPPLTLQLLAENGYTRNDLEAAGVQKVNLDFTYSCLAS